jgi:hypothetical protein
VAGIVALADSDGIEVGLQMEISLARSLRSLEFTEIAEKDKFFL